MQVPVFSFVPSELDKLAKHMNLLSVIKRRFQRRDATESLGGIVHNSTELCGVVFVFVDARSETLNAVLPAVQGAASMHDGWFIGMLSGLLQFAIRNVPQDEIERRTKALSEEIGRSAGKHALVVWTVQRCVHGCWGDNSTISYGVLTPNLREIMNVLGSSKLGEIIKI